MFVIILFLGILWSFSFYFNAISPAQMTQYTLSNGEKQVVFQEMIHIAKPRFYTQVQDDITAFKQNGWVYFFEGVKPGKKENSDKFDKALWIKFSPDLYKNISKLYGLEYQNNSDFLWLVNDLDFNIDTDLDTVIALYEEKKQKTQAVQEETEIPIDVSEDLIEVLSGLQPRQLTLMIYVNQAIMNAIVQSDGTKDFLQNNFNNQLLFDVILNERNKIVTKQIISGEHKKMFITYGQLHFSWILDLLQESDSNWKIISQKTYYPISKKLDF